VAEEKTIRKRVDTQQQLYYFALVFFKREQYWYLIHPYRHWEARQCPDSDQAADYCKKSGKWFEAGLILSLAHA
jgi:hypothetical protein